MEKSREAYKDASVETESDKYQETATQSAPGTDSQSVADRDVLPGLYGCYSAQDMPTNPAANASRNIIPQPQLQHQLPRQYHQDFENYRPLNTADTIGDPVTHSLSNEERTDSASSSGSTSGGRIQPVVPSDWKNPCSKISPQQLSYRPEISGKTQPSVPTGWMTNPSVTIPPLQPKLQLSITCGETFTNSGPLTTTTALVTDICSIKNDSDSLSSSAYTIGRTLPVNPSTCINIAHSTIQPSQRYLQLSPSCCHNFTNYVSQPQASPPGTNLLSMIDGSVSLPSGSTSNIVLPNVPSVCMNTPSSTIPPPGTKTEFSLLCSSKFTQSGPLNIAECPGTDFRSIDSLSSSFPPKSSGTLPVITSAWMTAARTTIPQRQLVMRPPQWSCGNLPSYGAEGTSYYDTLIRQYDLNSRYLNGS